MKLGIITGNTVTRGPDGRLHIHPPLGRLYDGLRARFPGARLCVPVVESAMPINTYGMAFEPDEIDVLPPMATTIRAQRYLVDARRVVARFAAKSDALFIRYPFQVPLALMGLGRPKVLHVVSNQQAVVDASTEYKGVWRHLAQAFARHTAWSLKRLAHEPFTSVATNGEEMQRWIGAPRGRVVISSSLLASELDPTPRPLGDPPRLLFLAFLRPEKGIFVLLEAFERLRRERPLKLTLAGGKDRAGETEQKVLARIAASPFASDISVTGTVDFGPELFALYKAHDLHVLPSLSEGTPRTLVEARAFGCPIVATTVGGIPSSVTDGVDGLLVPPRDAPALAAAIARVLDDAALRARLVEAGAAKARGFTLEAFVDALADELRGVFSAARRH